MTDSSYTSRRSVLNGIGAVGLASTGISRSSLASGKQKIPERVARETAKAKVEQLAGADEFENWERGKVGPSELFYTPRGTNRSNNYEPAAYVFSIDSQGKSIGYMTVAANKRLSPILGYGTGPAPQNRLDRVGPNANAGSLSVGNRYLYLNGMSYGIEATDHDAPRGLHARFLDLKGGFSIPLPERKGVSSFENNNDKAEQSWRTIDKNSPTAWVGQVKTQRSTDDNVYPNVPNWSNGDNDDSWAKWDGCSPIAASMVIGYHENTISSNRDALIDTLHQHMSTRDIPFLGNGLTIPGDIPRGIRNYDSGTYDYESPSNNFTGVITSRKQQTRNHIGDDNPIMLSTMDLELVGHSETVVGYDDANSFYYKCHDTYGGVNWIKHKSWATGFTTPIRPK